MRFHLILWLLFPLILQAQEAETAPSLAVADSLESDVEALYDSGRYAEAILLAQEALSIREGVLDPEHLDVAKSLSDLAVLMRVTGDYAAARSLVERALAIREAQLGPDHPDVARSLNDLAVLMRVTGDYAAARSLFERALAIREVQLGPDHSLVAASLNDLASLLQETGDYAVARRLYERALAIREAEFGPTHPYVATSLSDLARLLQATGNYAAARRLYERALAIYEAELGPTHPYVATSLNNLAVLLELTGDYAAARPLYESALAIREAALGPTHPEVASILGNLAGLLRSMGDYAAARSLYERALAIEEAALGPTHFYVAMGLNNLAVLLRMMGDHASARPFYERALAIVEAELGPTHPYVAVSLVNLAGLLRTKGDYAVARPLFERALAIVEAELGPTHPHVAMGLNNLAGLLQEIGDYATARPLYERALAIQEATLGPVHPDVAISLVSLGSAMRRADSSAAALPFADRAVSIFEAAAFEQTLVEPVGYVGALDARARIHHTLGDTTAALDDLDEALALLEQPRALAGGEQERARFLQQFDGMYATLFAWHLEAEDLDDALAAAERGRARTLRDQLAAAQVDLRADIPPDILAPLETTERTLTTRIATLRAQLNVTRERTDLADNERLATVEALTDSLRDAQAAFAANDAAIKGASPTWRSYLTAEGQEVNLQAIQRDLVPPNGQLLYYVVGEEAAHVLVIPAGRGVPAAFALTVPDSLAAVLGVEAGPLSSDALTALLDAPADPTQVGLLATLGTRGEVLTARRDGPLPAEQLAALRHVLVPDAAWSLIAEASEVVIIPDGALHRLPFEALVTTPSSDSADARYWLDEGPMIRYAPSATVLYELTQRPAPSTVARFDTPLVLSLSDPLFTASEVAEAFAQAEANQATADSTAMVSGNLALLADATRDAYERAGGSLARLPGTAAETAAIRRAFGEAADRVVVTLQQAEAREPAVRTAVAGKRYLHFGTHGLVDEHSGHLFAALALAPPPEA
ncbi:MAG: tetratricopeptide repeat protein, partial [Bacteroidota bacterium]